jgi:anti-anti-sigma factor
MSSSQPTSASPVRGSNTELPPPVWENHSARFGAEWDATRVIVTAHGELDASNAGQLADYFDLCIEHSTPLVLDLSGLKFFGTAGFSALHVINVKCAGAGLRWALVPSKPVSRLLRICDPDRSLPVISSIQAMPDADGDDPDHDRLFELVP